MIIKRIKAELRLLADPKKAQILQRFFKTGKGEYGEGDIFIGITVPDTRKIAKKYRQDVELTDLTGILHSQIHEERLCALLILIEKFQRAEDRQEQEEVMNFYINPNNLKRINNWDLVDVTCYKIPGEYLLNNPDKINILYNFTQSNNLWIRRISIVSTFAFIRQNQFEHTVKIAENLLKDRHDLIHKAVGWMLREVGKRDKNVLVFFLDKHYLTMPRIMLSYAIEKFDNNERARYKKRSNL